jgi:hypothetical protein
MSETKFIVSPRIRSMTLFIMLWMQSLIIVSRKLTFIRIEETRFLSVIIDQLKTLVQLRWIYLPSLLRTALSRFPRVPMVELELPFVGLQVLPAIIVVNQVTGHPNVANLRRFALVHLLLETTRRVDLAQKTDLPTRCGPP